MATNHEAIVKRTNLYYIDPQQIKVIEGWNKRKDFGDLEALCQSIINHPGVKVPLRVKKDSEGNITLIDGERRLKATMMAIERGHDIKAVPAIIEDRKMSQVEMMYLQILANDGKNFDPVEEAHAFNQLLQWGSTIDEIATKLGKSSVHVRERLVLINAVPEVQKAVADQTIPIGEGKRIVKESDGDVEKQRQALKAEVSKRATKKANKEAGVKTEKTPDLERVLKVLKIEMKKGTPKEDQMVFASEIRGIVSMVMENIETMGNLKPTK